MILTNDDIEHKVRMLAAALLQDAALKPSDKPAIDAGVDLIVNLLQNLNDIPYQLQELVDLKKREQGLA